MRIFILTTIILISCKANNPPINNEEAFWNRIELKSTIPDTNIQHPSKALHYKLSKELFKKLSKAGASEEASIDINIPNPNGDLIQFKVWDSGVIAPELAKKFPYLKTFKGYEKANPSNRIRLEMPSGILTVQITGDTSWLISPYNREKQIYLVYLLTDLPEKEKNFWEGKIE